MGFGPSPSMPVRSLKELAVGKIVVIPAAQGLVLFGDELLGFECFDMAIAKNGIPWNWMPAPHSSAYLSLG